MGNQQNLGPKVAERVFGAVFPSYLWAVGLHGVVACLASRKYRWVQFPHGPLYRLNSMVECLPYKKEVMGSSPLVGTRRK